MEHVPRHHQFGKTWTADTITDAHLLHVELFLLGRAPDHLKNWNYGPGHPGWERTYSIVRTEIEKRGLEMLPATGGMGIGA